MFERSKQYIKKKKNRAVSDTLKIKTPSFGLAYIKGNSETVSVSLCKKKKIIGNPLRKL